MFWVVGFVLAGIVIYPYAFIGIYLGPPLLFLGIIGWFKNYKRLNNRFPNPIRSFRITRENYDGFLANHRAMMDYLLNHLLEFWTLCILFWIVLSFIGIPAFKSSKIFKTVTEYVENDQTLKDKIGEIQYYGFLVSGKSSSNGQGDVSFSIIGQKETVKAWAKIENIDGQSQVVEMTYH